MYTYYNYSATNFVLLSYLSLFAYTHFFSVFIYSIDRFLVDLSSGPPIILSPLLIRIYSTVIWVNAYVCVGSDVGVLWSCFGLLGWPIYISCCSKSKPLLYCGRQCECADVIERWKRNNNITIDWEIKREERQPHVTTTRMDCHQSSHWATDI
jgi:hypothetical protein